MSIPIEQIIVPRLGRNLSANNNSNDKSVNPKNSCHDDGHDRLHHQLRSHDSHRCHPNSTFRRPIRRPHTWHHVKIRERTGKGSFIKKMRNCCSLQEKTRADAAPMNPKNGAVSSPAKADVAIFVWRLKDRENPKNLKKPRWYDHTKKKVRNWSYIRYNKI